MAKEIALTYGRKALVDERDYDRLIQYVWFAKRERGRWYAARRNGDDGGLVYMHEEIAQPAPGWGVRHSFPFQTLNNRRDNLVRYRIENNPRTLQRPYRGVQEVVLADNTRRYVARIKANGKTITIGRFTDAVEAAKAYDLENYRINGEAALNVANCKDALLEAIREGRI
jgi:hypothetical protein